MRSYISAAAARPLLLKINYNVACEKCALSGFLLAFILFQSSAVLAAYEKSAQAVEVTQTQHLTVEEAITLAFVRSPTLAQAFAQIKKGEARKDEATSAYYPQLSLSSNYGLHHEYAYGPKLKQLIYDFGKTSGAIDNQTYLTESYRAGLMKTITEVTGNTLLAYSNVKRYEEIIAVTQRMIASLENVKSTAELRLTAGLSSSADALQASTRIASYRTTLEQYRSQLQNARVSLAQLTGKYAETLSELPPALEPDLSHNNGQVDYSSVPAVSSAVSQVKAGEAILSSTKAQHLPSISLDAGYLRQYNRNFTNANNGWDTEVGVSVDVPLYSGGAISARVSQAYEDLETSKANVNQAMIDADQRSATALSNWRGAEARMQSSRYQTDIALRTRDIYQEEYKLGERSLTDLLSVEQDVFQALSNTASAKFDRYDAVINFAVIQNTLLSLLGVESPAEQALPHL
ncbi:TolC family outer membrane protein [Pseudomonas sp. D47]|uniref:TolC family outer membrane protein n=1 Tax=Pseudomonas sp. D47 TaxID=3159447 RepID=UPI00387B5C6A